MQAIRHADFREIMNAALQQGWKVEKTGKSHWKFIPPDKTQSIYIASGSPSDHRWAKTMRTELRRRGLVI